MKTILCAALFATAFNAGAEVLPLKEARDLAKEKNKPIVLLVTGSDWLPQAQSVRKTWINLEKAMADKAVWAIFDETAWITNDEVRKAQFPVEIYNLPEALVMDSQGRLIARVPANSVRKDEKALSKIIDKKLKICDKQENLLKKAGEVQGVSKAKLIGEALDTMIVTDAVNRNDLLKELKNADPQDETGYVFKYGLGAMPRTPGATDDLYKKVGSLLTENGTKKGKDRNFRAAEDFLKEKLKLEVLDVPQKQQLIAALAYVARQECFANGKNEAAWQKMLKYFKEIVKLNPKSEIGKGAQNYIDYYTKEVHLRGFDYESVHLRRDFVTWVVDASRFVKKPGVYSIKFVKDGGNDRIAVKNVSFKINDKTVAELPSDKKGKESLEFELTLSEMKSGSHVKLCMEVKGIGHWLDTFGHIEITKK